ncbi:MAG: MCE family protein [Thermoleophilaceae bacterium]|nr:MCE family protein [Thermoleophilaceae bacterium]
MTRAIRKYSRDFIAVVLLFVMALGVGGYILSNQRFTLPQWFPVGASNDYEINVELSTAQAVVPGQGQTMTIAGVQVGSISKVTLKEGRAVVTVKVDRKYKKRIFRNATLLLRPKTGLKDMYLQLNPGTQSAGEMPEGYTVGVGNTLPDVNPDEVLAALDTDTRSYLQVLANSGGQAFEGKKYQANLRETFKRFEPTNRDLEKITKKLSQRRKNIANVVHNYSQLVNALGDKDQQLVSLVDSANENFQALAASSSEIQEALRELPPTLRTTNTALAKTGEFADVLGPTATALRPAARALGPALTEVRPFLRETTPIIRKKIRPFARQTQPIVRTLRLAAGDLATAAPALTRTVNVLNSLVNTLAYNPPGDEEGYLFYNAWAGHNGAQVFGTQDAHGPIRRGIVLASCATLGVLPQIGANNPQLQTLIDLLNAPLNTPACPQQTPLAGVSSRGKKKSGAAKAKPRATVKKKAAPKGTGSDPAPAPAPNAAPAPAPPALTDLTGLAEGAGK